MNTMFEKQVVVITGAGRGIGAAAAKMFAEAGAKVVVNDLNPEPANAVVAEIEQVGGEAIAVPGDVTAPDFPEELLKAAVEAYGKINILVNNAGYTWDGMSHKMADEQWEAILAVHLTAPFRMIRAAAQYMRDPAKEEVKAGGPKEPRCIINVSSTSGLHGNIGQANYAAAKMGVLGLTKTIAKEWGIDVQERKITVDEIVESLDKAEISEAFGTGTAATIASIELISDGKKDYMIPLPGPKSFSTKIFEELNKIKTGKKEDTHGWIYRI